MSESRDSEELVIIRRRSLFVDDDFHGGVWKIAYADFMTAMMAFFLVMWLINATNQETRESVAAYFNPVKLAEATPDKKGVSDSKKAEPSQPQEGDKKGSPPAANPEPNPNPERPASAAPAASTGPGAPPQASSAARPPRFDEAALFRDPYAVLADIAGGPAVTVRRERRIGISLGPPDREGMKGGEAPRDPFDPIYWQLAPQASTDRRTTGDRGSLPVDDDPATLLEGEAKKLTEGRLDATVATSGDSASAVAQERPASANPAQSSATKNPATRVQAEAPTPASPTPAAQPATAVPGPSSEPRPEAGAPAQEEKREAPAGQRETAAALLGAAIRAALEGAPATAGPVVEVKQTAEGVLVSLTDSVTFGMFAVGSAEPQPELVRTIDKIAPLLAGYSGAIVLRGHTDGRPFRTPAYDNWRLSTARAHMAYHMLLRAGVDQQRIERIEGYADRRLKQPNDPFAAPNRRIEILVKDGRS